MDARLCPNCGASQEEDASFCMDCGQPVGVPAASPAPMPAPPPQPPAPALAGRRRRGVLVLVAATGVIGAVALAAALLLHRRPPSEVGEPLLPDETNAGEAAPPLEGAEPEPTAASAVAGIDGGVETEQTLAPGENGIAAPAEPAGSPPLDISSGEGAPASPQPPSFTGEAAASLPAATASKPSYEAVFRCRRYAKFDVDPEDAQVYIDDRPIGKADDWDGAGGGRLYQFKQSGIYSVRLALKGYRTAWVRIIVSDGAATKVSIDTKLKKLKKK
ncbi:MAG: zinc-ribbon domain-containing protein [Acidobacteriota bacterium]